MDWDFWVLFTLISAVGLYLQNKISKIDQQYADRIQELEIKLSQDIGRVMNSHVKHIHGMDPSEAWRKEDEGPAS